MRDRNVAGPSSRGPLGAVTVPFQNVALAAIADVVAAVAGAGCIHAQHVDVALDVGKATGASGLSLAEFAFASYPLFGHLTAHLIGYRKGLKFSRPNMRKE